jgi:hypothetical protein
MVPVFFLTGNYTMIPVESYSNAYEVKEEVFKKMQINK